MEHKELAKHMNTVVFHTKMVDSLEEMLIETSDLSIYWFVNLLVDLLVHWLVCSLTCCSTCPLVGLFIDLLSYQY